MKKKKNRRIGGRDVHHILWTRRNWDHAHARALRDFWYCKISIPRDTLHRHIHEEVCKIPVPNDAICRSALEQLQLLERYGAIKETDSIEQRIKVIIATLDTGDSPAVEALERQLRAIQTYHRPG